MTQPAENDHLHTALRLAGAGTPVLPLRAGKVPFGNCRACTDGACGGRPNMKSAGPCRCPAPCHAWAAATTDTRVLTSPAWVSAWRRAAAVAYHPGAAGLTVVDLDNAAAVAWASETLPATRAVETTRGEHWLYRGAMSSHNAVRPGVDIKSAMAYARWLGPGTGRMTALPDVVRALVVKEPCTVRSAPHAVTVSAPVGGGECRHRTPSYLDRGIAMAEQRITEARSAVHATVYRTFLAVLSAHGRCGCLTDALVTADKQEEHHAAPRPGALLAVRRPTPPQMVAPRSGSFFTTLSSAPQQTTPSLFPKRRDAASPASPKHGKRALTCRYGRDAGQPRLRHPASPASPVTRARVTGDAPQILCVTQNRSSAARMT